MLKEFKEFIARGNVMDMAIGVVMGGAFSAIITSLVEDIIMPLVGLLTSGMDFTELKWVIQESPEVAISYGNLIQVVINFILIAFCIFMMVKGINKLKKQEEEVEEAEPEKSAEVLLLEEIRDSLKK